MNSYFKKNRTFVPPLPPQGSFYYNWRYINGYNAPLTVVWGRRGLGKTFGCVKSAVERYIRNGEVFVYIVETLDMVKELARDNGEKFFNGIIAYYKDNPSCKNGVMLSSINGAGIDTGEGTEMGALSNFRNIVGGTIKINKQTAGYIFALNDFANIKRNNFKNVGTIIIDEFIPENIDIRATKNAYKVVSLVQSICRLKDVRIYMLGNSIRRSDIILDRLGFSDMEPGQIRTIKDEHGLIAIGHYVNNADYTEFKKKSDASVAGRVAKLFGEENLDENTFRDDLPRSMMLPAKLSPASLVVCLHGENCSVRISEPKTFDCYYCTDDYGRNHRNRACVDKRFVGPYINYQPEWKDVMIMKYQQGLIKFDTSVTHIYFKKILNIA